MATVAMQNDQGLVGVQTGLTELDEKLGGLQIRFNNFSWTTFDCLGYKHSL